MIMRFFLGTLLLTTSTAWAGTATLDCALPADTTASLNRFTLKGSLDLSERGRASAQMSGSTRMAGIDSESKELTDISMSGTVRIYPAKSLGVNEVTLFQLRTVVNGKLVQLIAATGLKGPQSTLTIQGIPFRAECNLKANPE